MKKIAIVDDNPDNALLLEAILEGLYQTEVFYDGKSALAGFKDSLPDLVLMDISMPGLSGEDVLQLMRKDSELSKIPVVALTAHAMVSDKHRYLVKGFNGYLSKPILDEEELFVIIKAHLKQ